MAKEFKPKEIVALTDNDLMPSGKHQGIRMEDVPAKYLMYIYDNNMCNQLVKNYINDNLDVILEQAKLDGYASKDVD